MLEKNKICKTNGRVMVPVSRTVNLEYIWGTIAFLFPLSLYPVRKKNKYAITLFK